MRAALAVISQDRKAEAQNYCGSFALLCGYGPKECPEDRFLDAHECLPSKGRPEADG